MLAPSCAGAPHGKPWLGHEPAPAAGVEDSPLQVSSAPQPLVGAAWRAFTLPAHSLRVSLPEGAAWKGGNDGTFWRATHDATQSSLLVKRWREGSLVDASDCERQVLLWKPQLERPSVTADETLRMQALGTYHTDVSLYVTDEHHPRNVVSARLVAYGGSLRECFCFVYSTQAPVSPLSRSILRTRLQVMLQALQRAQLASALDGPAHLQRPTLRTGPRAP